MSRFTNIFDWYEPHGDKYITTKELVWEVGTLGSGLFVRVPIGFVFDKSVPRWLTWLGRWFSLFNPHAQHHLKGSALHDYTLYLKWDRVSAAAAGSNAWYATGTKRFERLVLVISVIIWNWW